VTDTGRRTLVIVAVAAVAYFVLSGRLITRDNLIFLAVLIPSVLLHEVSHGAVANLFGDDTAKRAGRLTLNPLRHVDPFGTVILPTMLVLAGAPPFGYAKPVPVNLGRLRRPRDHGLLVSLAGPATNLALVVVATIVWRVFSPLGTAGQFVYALGAANLLLALFNLLPIPPLDGSALVERMLPARWWPGWLKMRQYAMGILLLLLLMAPPRYSFGRLFFPVLQYWRDHFIA
jgi:Zn-dependent protease